MSALRKRAGENQDEGDAGAAERVHERREKAQGWDSSWLVSIVFIFYATIVTLVVASYYHVPRAKTSADEHSKGDFVEEKAREHLDIITSYGSRPAGSYANEIQAVEYFLSQLELIRASAKDDVVIEIDVQKPTGTFTITFLEGFTSYYRNVTNVLARISPKEHYPPKHALLVNAHFDTVPGSPGASDDAVSCVTMLEILRALAQGENNQLKHAIVFSFNGAEENFLQASHGFITQHPWAESLKAFVNLEATGAGGREVVFQTGPEHPWLVKAYARAAKHPFGSIIGQEIFQAKIIPGETDFRMYRDHGNIPGIDMAYIANGYVYHTKYDHPDAIPLGTIQRAGENVMSLLLELANSPLLEDPSGDRHGNMVFFDFLSLFMVLYPERVGVILNLVVAFVSVVCILKKYTASSKSKKKQETSTLIFNLVKMILVLVVSWCAAIAVPVGIAVFITAADRSLTWYCKPWLIVSLYGLPSLFASLCVHRLYRFVAKMGTQTLQQAKEVLLEKESDCFYANLLIWTVLLIVMTFYRISSAFVPCGWILFPVVVRVLVWDKLLHAASQKALVHEHSLKPLVFVNFASFAIPITYSFYLVWILFELFVPIFGRTGTEVPPDVVVAVFAAAAIIVMSSCMAGLVYVTDDVKAPSAALFLVSALSITAVCLGVFFPYKAGDPTSVCPKRVIVQHIHRTFYNPNGTVQLKDSGVWIAPMDYLGVEPINHVPALKELQPSPSGGVYSGFPYYIAIRNLFRKTWYLPGPPPEIADPMKVRLLSRRHERTIHRLEFLVKGPDHLTMYFSPAPGIELVNSSFGELLVSETEDERDVYFVFYSHGVDPGPWTFWIEFDVPQSSLPGRDLVDVAVASHHLHGEDSKTQFLTSVLDDLPQWVYSIAFVSSYYSWNIDYQPNFPDV